MVFSGLIQTSFGRVEMTDITIRTEVGILTGYLLKPHDVTAGNPAPAIVTSHGYLNNREMQDLNWVELSRRGYVVFAMNAYSHGDSSVPDKKYSDSVLVQSGGMVDAVEYVSGLPFVEKGQIGVTGHSMGGGYANETMKYYTSLVRDGINRGMSSKEAQSLNKITAGLIVGNYPDNLGDVADRSGNSGYLCDLGIIGGLYDEFFGASTRTMLDSDLSRTVVAVQTGQELQGKIEEGQSYQNRSNGFGVTMYQPREFHAWNHFSRKTVGHLLNFFDETLGAPKPLSSSNQIWWLKEFFNFLGLIGFFLFIIPFADLLLQIPYFTSLRASQMIPLSPLQGKGKSRYIISNTLGGLLSALIVIPTLMMGYLLLISKLLPQDTTGGIGLWALGSGFISWWMIRIGFGQRLKGHWAVLGVKVNKRTFFKTLLLAVMVVIGTYGLLFLADYLFQTDFRFWTFCIRVFSAAKVGVALKYLPLFAVYYIFNSLAVSRSHFENWSERKQIGMTALFNMMAPIIILMVTYIPVLWMGRTPWTMLPGIMAGAMALIPIILIPFVPILAIAAYIGVKCNKLTGNIWLGAIINSLIITMITVANTSFSFPY